MNNVDLKSFDDVVLNGGLVLVDFWAPWCTPCKMLEPILESLNPNFVKVAKVDIDKVPGLARKFSVKGVPTLILFKDGKIVNRHIGLMKKSNLLAFIEPFTSTPK